MTKFPLPLAVVGSLLLSLPLSACRAAENTPRPGDIGLTVAKALEQLHYTRHPLDDQMSDRLLKLYIDTLDYNKLFFTQKDIDGFNEKYDHTLDDSIFNADLQPAYTIYDVYLKRVESRVAKIKELLKTEKFDFNGNGTIELSRQKSPWPKDEADADHIWHDRIENELLTEVLSEHPADKDKAKADQPPIKPESTVIAPPTADTTKGATLSTSDLTTVKVGDHVLTSKVATPDEAHPDLTAAKATVVKRYDRLLRTLHEQNQEDETKYFLNALALAYDPHSEYMSPSEMDNFLHPDATLAHRHRRDAAQGRRVQQDHRTGARRSGGGGWQAQGGRPHHGRRAGQRAVRGRGGHEARQGGRENPRQEGQRRAFAGHPGGHDRHELSARSSPSPATR